MWKVILLFDTSGAASRRTIQGIARYSSLHGPWVFFREPPFYMIANGKLRTIKKLPDLGDQKADGIIAHIPYTRNGSQFVPEGIPAIVSPYSIRQFPNFRNLITDNLALGKMAAEYFLDRGFRNFAYCGFGGMYWSRERGESFAKRLKKIGLKTQFYEYGQLWSRRQSSRADNQALLAEWLKSLPKPLAVMACNDDRGQDITEACKIAGLRIPYDVAVLGVDNDDMVCDLTNPPLSSIAVNNERAGYEAAEMLAQMMAGKKTNKQVIVARPTHIVTRQSTDIFAVEDRGVGEALRFINEHARKLIHVDEVVNAAISSRRVLERRFRQILGRSILDEIRRVRIEQVIRMLVETNMSISEITTALGYPGVEHIARYFRQERGMSLLAYRKQYGQK
ncbi:MAG: DNA-binding transcriptional regulator [Sedimentisphaerales bacterium]